MASSGAQLSAVIAQRNVFLIDPSQRHAADASAWLQSELRLTVEFPSGAASTSFVFSPDNTLAAISCQFEMRVYRVSDVALLHTIPCDCRINSLSFSTDGTMVAMGCFGGKVEIWRVVTEDGTRSLVNTLAHGDQHADLNQRTWVNAVAFSPDGLHLATGCAAGYLRVWDVASWACLRTSCIDKYGINSIAYSRDGQWIVCGADETVKILRADSSDVVHSFAAEMTASSVAISPDNAYVAASGYDAPSIWQIDNGEELTVESARTDTQFNSVAFSADGAYLIATNRNHQTKLWSLRTGLLVAVLQGQGSYANAVTFSSDGAHVGVAQCDSVAQLWRLSEPRMTKTFVGHETNVISVAFSPNGELMATGSYRMMTKVWNVRSGKCVATFANQSTVSDQSNESGKDVAAITFSHDGSIIATAEVKGGVTLWRLAAAADPANYEPILTLRPPFGAHSRRREARRVCFNHDASMLATETELWSLSPASPTTPMTAVPLSSFKANSHVAFHLDGSYIIAQIMGSRVKVWSSYEEESAVMLIGHEERFQTFGVAAVAFSPNRQVIATVGGDTTLKLWRVKDGFCFTTIPDVVHRSSQGGWIEFSQDGKYIAICCASDEIKVWSVTGTNVDETELTVTLMATLVGPSCQAIYRCAFHPDSTVLVGVGAGVAHYAFATMWRVSEGVTKTTLTGHDLGVNCLMMSNDYSHIVTGSNDKTAKLWRASDGMCVATLRGHDSDVVCVTFTVDGTLIATGTRGNAIYIWDAASSSACRQKIVGHADTTTTASITFSPDNKLIASGSSDAAARVWSVAGGACVSTFTGHTDCILSVAFSGDSQLLATGSRDRSAKIWRVSDGACTHTLEHEGPVCCVAFSQDLSKSGIRVATGSEDRSVRLWKPVDEELGEGAPISGVDVLMKCVTLGSTPGSSPFSVAFRLSDDTEVEARTHLLGAVKRWRCCVDGSSSELTLMSSAVLAPMVTELAAAFRGASTDNALRTAASRKPLQKPFPYVFETEVYRRDAPIGRGSSCDVFVATYDRKSYAYKVYFPDVVREIQRELHVAAFLQHRHIVRVAAKVVKRNATEQPVGLLMELCDGSLQKKITQLRRPRPRELVEWLHQVAQAVVFAHSKNVVHSDIKPENILLVEVADGDVGEDNEPPVQRLIAKLTDFGSCLVLSTTSTLPQTTQEARGTALYMAPEYTAGETGPTKAADVFSFGMTMWSVLSPPDVEHGLGVRPSQQTLSLDRSKRPPVAHLYPIVANLISRCWDHTAGNRPTMGEVEETLRNLDMNTPVPCTKLWATHLQTAELENSCVALRYTQVDNIFFSEDITSADHPCYQFICDEVGDGFDMRRLARIVMVGLNERAIAAFTHMHDADSDSCAINPILRVEPATDAATTSALKFLQGKFLPPPTGHSPLKPPPIARLVFGWHGTPAKNVAAICRDGPRSVRVESRDGGFFGIGSYFALEAKYANTYSGEGDPLTNEQAIILFAISVSQVKVVTPENDYLDDDDDSPSAGMSVYFPSTTSSGMSIEVGFDAHFIPVKDYGKVHPRTGRTLRHNVWHQAVAQHSGEAEAHELVIASHHRCVPLAVVYCKPSA